MLESLRKWIQKRRNNPLFILAPNSRVHDIFLQISDHRIYEFLHMILVLTSVSIICLERPGMTPEMRWKLDVASLIVTCLFILDILVKSIGDGFVIGLRPYLHSLWNIFNLVLVLISLVDILFMAFPYRPRILMTIKILLLFRVPMLMKQSLVMLHAFQSLKNAFGMMFAVGLLWLNALFIFSLLGLRMFKGSFYYCKGRDLTNIRTKDDCLKAGYQWLNKFFNFDSVPWGMLTMFVIYTGDGWGAIVRSGIAAVGAKLQPVRNRNLWIAICCVSFILLGNLLTDMLIGGAATSQQQRLIQREQLLWSRPRDKTRHIRYTLQQMRARAILYDPFYKATICTSVFFSMVLMGVNMKHQTMTGSILVMVFQAIFIIILTSEIFITLVAFGFRRFLSNKWNYIYMFSTLVMVISLVLDQMQLTGSIPFDPTVMKTFQILRFLQALRSSRMRRMALTFMRTLALVWSLGGMYTFIILVYGNLGVDLFGTLECSKDYPCIGLSRYINFVNFWQALLALFRLFTGDDWSDIWKDTGRPCRPGDTSCSKSNRWISAIFFMTYFIACIFILFNLLLGLVVESIDQHFRELREKRESMVQWQLKQLKKHQVQREQQEQEEQEH